MDEPSGSRQTTSPATSLPLHPHLQHPVFLMGQRHQEELASNALFQSYFLRPDFGAFAAAQDSNTAVLTL